MSALCGIELTIESLVLLRRTLNELKLQHSLLEEMGKEEQKLFKMVDEEGNTELVDIAITGPYGTRMGLQKQKGGGYRVISSASSSSQIQRHKDIANRIKQRYAYNRVKEELSSKGYSVVEEKDIGNKTIKLVARRWG